MNTFKGKSIHVDDQYLHVELEDGRIISTPMDWYPELKRATIDQLKQYQFICHNTGIEWKELDYHLIDYWNGNPLSEFQKFFHG
jgi:hypothetical protein